MRTIIASIVVLSIFASCSKKSTSISEPFVGEVSISSTIEATRASGTNWSSGDQIGVFMSFAGDDMGELGENVLYTNINADGENATFTSLTPLYFSESSQVDLLCYYPYVDGCEATSYRVDVSNQMDLPLIDLMSGSSSDVTPTTEAVDISFAHKLSNIVITIKAGEGLSEDDLEGLSVTLSGLIGEANYNLTTNDIELGDTAMELLICTSEDGLSAQAIVIPQDLDGVKLIFATQSIGNFEAPIYTSTFESGTQYSYTATINCLESTLKSNGIEPWIETTSEDITADPSGGSTSGGEDLDSEGDDEIEDEDTTLDPDPSLEVDFDYDYDIELIDGVYEINSAKGLTAFADLVNGFSNTSGATTYGANFADFESSDNKYIEGKLMTSISLSSPWTPIGTSSSTPYIGVFDGNDKVISGLSIYSSDSYQALFGYVGDGNSLCEIKNLTIYNPSITGGKYVGAVVGYARMVAISRCAVVGGSISGDSNVGGFAGYLAISSSITTCYNTSIVKGSSYVGGIAGELKLYSISSCYNTGAVSSEGSYAGGIVGYSGSGATVYSCYNTGEVSGASSVGGIIGNVSSVATECYYISISSLGSADGAVQIYDVTTLNSKVNAMATQQDGTPEFTIYADETSRLPSLLGELIYYDL